MDGSGSQLGDVWTTDQPVTFRRQSITGSAASRSSLSQGSLSQSLASSHGGS